MSKDSVRDRVWDALEEGGEARFPFPPHGRIPNFAGADRAAERLASTTEWADADAIKANPDAPQLPVRRRALREGKRLFVAVPRLRDRACFYELDPDRIDDVDAAATVSHVEEYADRVAPRELPGIDLIVSGSVAVDEGGTRIGKGEGYSDLEFALLREIEAVGEETPTATTVHEIQVRDEELQPDPHDVPMDLVVTPSRVVRTGATGKPPGIRWEELSEDRIEEIPVLATFDGRGAYADRGPSGE